MTAPLTKERIELIANRAWKEAGWGDIHASGAEWHLCKTAVEVALRALSAPEEFVSAPREPTADMTAVMLQAIKDGMLINDDAERSIRHGYRAMLAAAPQAPAGEDQRASHCALKPNKNSANAGQMGTVQDKQVGDCTEAHPNAETLATCVAICAALCEPPKDTWDAGYNAGCRDYRDRIVRLIEHPPAPSGKWVSVPKEIDRAKHRAVLDVWNQCMAEAETLEMAWPKLVAAISAAPVNTASAWVSVKERLPEDGQEVRFQVWSGAVFNGWFAIESSVPELEGTSGRLTGKSAHFKNHFFRGDFSINKWTGSYTYGTVRQWTPLPAAPAEGE